MVIGSGLSSQRPGFSKYKAMTAVILGRENMVTVLEAIRGARLQDTCLFQA